MNRRVRKTPDPSVITTRDGRGSKPGRQHTEHCHVPDLQRVPAQAGQVVP